MAIDWILDHMEVGGQIFSDLAYADDRAFLFSTENNCTVSTQLFTGSRQVGIASGRSLGGDWRRRPGRGRPRAHWTYQLCNDTGAVPANLRRHDTATKSSKAQNPLHTFPRNFAVDGKLPNKSL